MKSINKSFLKFKKFRISDFLFIHFFTVIADPKDLTI
jgi:hypothetical protein